jgi:hypothetical protein
MRRHLSLGSKAPPRRWNWATCLLGGCQGQAVMAVCSVAAFPRSVAGVVTKASCTSETPEPT